MSNRGKIWRSLLLPNSAIECVDCCSLCRLLVRFCYVFDFTVRSRNTLHCDLRLCDASQISSVIVKRVVTHASSRASGHQMMNDRPKRSTQQGHSYPDRSRQLTFANAGTPERSSRLRAAVSRRACFFSLLILLGLVGFVAFHRGTPFHSQASLSSDRLRQFGLSASNELHKCTPTSISAVCTWARQHSRVNRKRPTDWEPKEGWPQELEVTPSLHHASDRALTALDNATGSSQTTRESLQNVLHSLWPMQSKPDLPILEQSSLPQCAALYRQPCIALVGKHCCTTAS